MKGFASSICSLALCITLMVITLGGMMPSVECLKNHETTNNVVGNQINDRRRLLADVEEPGTVVVPSDDDESGDDGDSGTEEGDEEVAAADAPDAKMAPEDGLDAIVEGVEASMDAVISDAADDSMNSTAADVVVECPIDLLADDNKLSASLDLLMEPCGNTVNVTEDPEGSKKFCTDCVRPLQTFLAREFHVADARRNMSDPEENDWDAENVLIHRQCAQDATDYLSEKGMAYDDAFHANVFACSDFSDDPGCPIPTAELVADADMVTALKACDVHHPEASEILYGGNESHPFCVDCYWPFYETLLKKTLSDNTLCALKNETGTLTYRDIEILTLEDADSFACLMNVEGHLANKGMLSPSTGLQAMEAICFNDMNHPSAERPALMEWLTQDDMKEKLDGLDCSAVVNSTVVSPSGK